VELGDARAAIFAITEPLEHRDLALEVLAHARDRDLSVLPTKPSLADGDELREDTVLPYVVAEQCPHRPEALTPGTSPRLVCHADECDRRAVAHVDLAHRLLVFVRHAPPVAQQHRVTWLHRVAQARQVGHEGGVSEAGGPEPHLESRFGHPLT